MDIRRKLAPPLVCTALNWSAILPNQVPSGLCFPELCPHTSWFPRSQQTRCVLSSLCTVKREAPVHGRVTHPARNQASKFPIQCEFPPRSLPSGHAACSDLFAAFLCRTRGGLLEGRRAGKKRDPNSPLASLFGELCGTTSLFPCDCNRLDHETTLFDNLVKRSTTEQSSVNVP